MVPLLPATVKVWAVKGRGVGNNPQNFRHPRLISLPSTNSSAVFTVIAPLHDSLHRIPNLSSPTLPSHPQRRADDPVPCALSSCPSWPPSSTPSPQTPTSSRRQPPPHTPASPQRLPSSSVSHPAGPVPFFDLRGNTGKLFFKISFI